jgi:hypothetical protein
MYYRDMLIRNRGLSTLCVGEGDKHVLLLRLRLCGCGTWSLTFREEHILRVFKSRLLRGISGCKREKVTDWLIDKIA